MGYESTTGVIIYWNPDQQFIIHKAHHVQFDENNSRLSIEDKHTLGSLLLSQDAEGHIHDSDLLNLIPCKLDLTSNPFSDEKLSHMTLSYLPLEKKIGFNLVHDENFTVPYITDTIQNSTSGHQLPSQAKRNVWIVAINGEETITAQGVIDKLNSHQT